MTHHVYPLFGPAHETEGDGAACWCGPVATQACPVCADDPDEKVDCCHCAGHGWVYPAFSADPDWPTVILHWAAGTERTVESAARRD